MDPLATTPDDALPAAHDERPGWEGRIARGFRLARVSLEVLAGDRRLLLLPMLSAFCALLALLADATLARRLHGGPDALRVIAPVWAAAYAVSFITIFFNVALVHVVVGRWRGEPTRLRDGVAAARGRLAAIAGWAVLTTTVGIVLQLVERLTFGISRIVADVAWSVASFFVVPVLVVERRGPVRALRRSAQVVREHWAEGIAGATPIALATLMVVLPLVGLLFIGLVLYVTGLTVPGLLAMGGAGIAIVAVCIVSGAVGLVFTLAVYQHATGGPYDDGFPAADLERPREGALLDPLRRLRVR
ncbi:MAG: hypothetical protein QOJ35_1726 [Solirubrobacteraceae bacterium]|jgi:hypothetical protein|nr:hypothetical protein [Solirubrobacteraceae bacterium]